MNLRIKNVWLRDEARGTLREDERLNEECSASEVGLLLLLLLLTLKFTSALEKFSAKKITIWTPLS